MKEMQHHFGGPAFQAWYALFSHIQSNLCYVTFLGNIQIGSHKAGGR